MKKNKSEIVTFKADHTLLEAMKGIPNRSEFIRSVVMHALESVCPLCRGTGILTPDQKDHWKTFTSDHRVEECDDCHEMHIVCTRQKGELEK